MVDLQNGLTCKFLEIGTTSFTFSVEWPLDVEIPNGLRLRGRLDPDDLWSFMRELVLDPEQKPVYKRAFALSC
jgi:hypothetical protein